jgi:hypothetical protein
MIDKCLREEQVPRVDERLVRVVRIIVEQYDGDVRAFVESIRCRVNVIRGAEAVGQGAGVGPHRGTLEH